MHKRTCATRRAKNERFVKSYTPLYALRKKHRFIPQRNKTVEVPAHHTYTSLGKRRRPFSCATPLMVNPKNHPLECQMSQYPSWVKQKTLQVESPPQKIIPTQKTSKTGDRNAKTCSSKKRYTKIKRPIRKRKRLHKQASG